MKSLQEKFEDRIDIRGDCWIWVGPMKGEPPLPIFTPGGNPRSARRVSLELAGHEAPTRLKPTCGNPLCVKPDHLVGAGSDQLQESNLTENKVEKILGMLATGKYKHKEIAEKFSLRQSTVGDIASGGRWAQARFRRLRFEGMQVQLPGYYTSKELRLLLGWSHAEQLAIAEREGWESYRVQLTYLYKAEDIENYLTGTEYSRT